MPAEHRATRSGRALVSASPAVPAGETLDSAPGANAQLGAALLARARNAIAEALRCPLAPEPWHPALRAPGATFVTLTRGGALRGCIGALEAHLPLERDVRLRAHAAAFEDPRFAPVQRAEYDALELEVSLIGPIEPIDAADLADATGRLRPHVDGVVLSWRERRATFLPQVWEQIGEREAFVEALARKAGVGAVANAGEIRLSRYRVDKWREIDVAAAPPERVEPLEPR